MVTINIDNDLSDYVLRSLQVGRSQKMDKTDGKAFIKEKETIVCT